MTPRAETVGSLLRPPYLAEARAAHEAGTLSADDLRAVEDRAVDEAIALQEACGLDVVSDGEMRRGVFTGSLSTPSRASAARLPRRRPGTATTPTGPRTSRARSRGTR